MTSDMDAALVELRAVCKRAYDAQVAKDAARKERRRVAAQTWKVLYELGPKNIAKHMGADEGPRAGGRAETGAHEAQARRGPPPHATLTRRQKEAIDKLRDSILAFDKASKELSDALDQRWHTIRRTWPTLAPMGQRAIARAVGGGYVGESTISVTTTDLRKT